MASNITLSAGVRQNLLSLQNTAELMATTQNRLATGKKVNSALDNPSNFFTASSLQSRGNDLSSLLDSMSTGIKTLEAADNGITSITKTVESMQSTLRQARQDKSFQTASYSISAGATGNLSFSDGSVGSTPVDIALTTTGSSATAATASGSAAIANDTALQSVTTGSITLTAGGNTATYTVDNTSTKAALTSALTAQGFTATFDGSNNLQLSRADGVNFTVSGTAGTLTGLGVASGTTTDGVEAVAGGVKSVDTLVSEINANSTLSGKVVASNDGGKLRIQNISTAALTLTGASSAGIVDGSTSTTDIGGNETRKSLVKQFNELRDQLDKTADDASYNGVNLLRKDKLKLTFNETGTSTMEIQVKDTSDQAMAIDASSLDITSALDADFNSDTSIDDRLATLGNALGTLRSQASSLGSKLSIVQNRQDFTKSMINTLQTGADGLVLADSNEEAANLLALQTRQQLSSTALSMAAQADQAVLRLF